MSRAGNDALDALHEGLAAAWQARLGTGEPLSAAEFTALAKFLKDNNITALPGSPRMTPLPQGLEALNGDDETNLVDLGRFRTGE